MRNIFYKAIFFALFSVLFGVIELNAQTALRGKYVYEGEKAKKAFSFLLGFEGTSSVFYSYQYEGAGTLKGSWTREKGVIRVEIPQGDTILTLKLKQAGERLIVAEPLRHPILKRGDIFKKLSDARTAPDLTAQEVGNRVLKLLKTIKNVSDISPANLGRQTGLEVSFNKTNRNEYGFGGNVSDAPDWTYNFFAYPYPSQDNTRADTFRFSFNYGLNEPADPNTDKICTAINLAEFSRQLQEAGFSAPQPRRAEHGRLTGYEFSKPDISLVLYVKGGWEPNVNNCVQMILVSFAK